jgi:AcrR family transcriptional regulator
MFVGFVPLLYSGQVGHRSEGSIVSTKATRNRRLPAEERRAQIVEAVLDVVGKHGVPGATVARIAAAAGVSEGALYVHFESRDEMLMAALDSIYTEMSNLIESSTGETVLERLALIARNHSSLMKTKLGAITSPWIEFVAVGPQVGLRDLVADVQTRLFNRILSLVLEGQADGSIRGNLSARSLTWQFYTIMWAENVSSLMGLTEYIDDGHSAYSLDLLVREASAGCGPASQS